MVAVFILKGMNIHFRGILSDSNVIYLGLFIAPLGSQYDVARNEGNFSDECISVRDRRGTLLIHLRFFPVVSPIR